MKRDNSPRAAAMIAVQWVPLMHAVDGVLSLLRDNGHASVSAVVVSAAAAHYGAGRLAFDAKTRSGATWTLGLCIACLTAMPAIASARYATATATWVDLLAGVPAAGALAALFAWIVWPVIRADGLAARDVVRLVGAAWILLRGLGWLALFTLAPSLFGDGSSWLAIAGCLVPAAVVGAMALTRLRQG